MPSVAEEHPRVLPAGKKRRRDNDMDGLQGAIYEQAQHHIQQQYAFADFGKLLQHHDAALPLGAFDNASRKIMPIKRQRLFGGDEDSTVHYPDGHRARRHSRSPSNTAARPQPTRLSSSIVLAPCHVCHRKPTKKSDLDSFAECHGCKARTCFVCLRQCKGWTPEAQRGQQPSAAESRDYEEALSRSFHMEDADDDVAQRDHGHQGQTLTKQNQGRMAADTKPGGDGWSSTGHQQVVCSKCCIERGQEGDVVCLGCLSQM
ncbi:hypothetical protein ACHAQA_002450 [Verticillium albo-atrum]